MAVLDCADPSMQVDKRNETGSPLQALALYNNGLMLTLARHLAARVENAGSDEGQVAAACRLALGRSAHPGRTASPGRSCPPVRPAERLPSDHKPE